MNLYDVLLEWKVIRNVGTIVLLIMYFEVLRDNGFAAFAGCTFILLLDIILIWINESWWNEKKYIFITLLIIAIALSLQFGYGVNTSKILWPLIWIFAYRYKKYEYLSIILALFSIMIILLMSYIYPFPFETCLTLIGMFLWMRSKRIHQDAYQTSKLHLKELNEAHRELHEAHERLQDASVYSMRYAALEERTRLAREIHDGLGHQLTSLIVQLQALEIMLPDDPIRAAELVKQLIPISRRAMAEVRLAVREWTDDEMGLGLIALKGLVSQTQARSSIKFNFVQETEISEWPIETSIVVYRVLQESLTNILRHSNAESARINIKEIDEKIIISIIDDGIYTENTPHTLGFGLKGIMERCRIQGGTCSFIPEEPHGLRVEATFPIEHINKKSDSLTEEPKNEYEQ